MRIYPLAGPIHLSVSNFIFLRTSRKNGQHNSLSQETALE